jgi:hypothetical protein
MNKLISTSLFFIATFFSINAWSESAKNPQEKLIIDRDGVKVWTFKKPGNAVVNFSARTVVESTLSGAVGIVMDTDHISDWAPYIGNILMLDRNNQNGEFKLRVDIDFPFPLSNRDVVLAGRIHQNADGTVNITNKVIEDPRAPVRDKFIRLDRYEGSWTFRSLPKTAAGKPQVEVTNSGYAYPNGLLPIFIINMFVQEQPFEMLRNMQSQVKLAKYQKMTVEGVKEPS